MLKAIFIVLALICTDCLGNPFDQPNKESLISVLNEFHDCLIREDYRSASKLVKMPAGLQESEYPKLFDGLLQRRELSSAGIQKLSSSAKFGPVADLFDTERANSLAQKSGVSLDKLYGFNFETESATAEVAAIWDGQNFKLIRFDDIGKLAEPTAAQEEKVTPQTQANTREAIMAAVAKDPKNHQLRAQLATKFYEASDIKNAWQQMRIAASLDPKNQQYAGALVAVLADLENAGTFSVGVTSETLQKDLGPPDEKVDMGNKKVRYLYSVLGVDLIDGAIVDLIDLRNATQALFEPTEVVALDLDGREWSVGFRKREEGLVMENWFLDHESPTNWTEQFSIERLLDVSEEGSATELANFMINAMKAGDENVVGKILASDEESATVSLEIPIGEGAAIHRLIRLIKGPKDVHRVAVSLVKRPDEATQKKWFAMFQKAYLKPIKN
jgi:hypothetical protein